MTASEAAASAGGPEQLLQYGALGIICLVLIGWCMKLYANSRSDRLRHSKERTQLTAALIAEKQARIHDAERVTGTVMKLHQEIIMSISSIDKAGQEHAKLGKTVRQLVEYLRARNEQRPDPGLGGGIRPPRR